jgi:hypothetical protein
MGTFRPHHLAPTPQPFSAHHFGPAVSPPVPIRSRPFHPQVMQYIFELDSHFVLISTLILCTCTV